MDRIANANPNDRVKLVNARIADVENDCYFGSQVSLVIQNGKIIAMPGLPGEPDEPTDAVIDLQGLTVIPGLFNTHCHLQLLAKSEYREMQIAKSLSDCLDRGITNIRDTLCYDIRENQKLMQKIANGEIPGPRIHQAIHVGPLGGTYSPKHSLMTRFLYPMLGMPVLNYSNKESGVVAFRPNADAQEVRNAVDRAIDERGAAAIKFCDQPERFMTYKPGAAVITAHQLETAIGQAIRRGIPTTIHNVTVEGFRQATKYGITSLAHLPIDNDLTEADASLLIDSASSIEPTLTVAYYMSYSLKGSPFSGHPEMNRLDEFRNKNYSAWVDESWVPELRKSQYGQHEALRKGDIKILGFIDLSEPFKYFSKCMPTGGKNLKFLIEHGAVKRLGCGNDAGPVNCSPSSIGQELRMMDFMLNREDIKCYSAADALRTATIQSARSMGMDAQFGSIHTGKVADLVVLDGDPLQDYDLIGRPVQALFLGGRLAVNRCGLRAVSPEQLASRSDFSSEVQSA